jgi:hypothetical protein
LAGVALVLAVGLLASRTCQSEMASAEIRIRVGDAGRELRLVRAELYRAEDPAPVAYSEWPLSDRGSGPTLGPWRLRADAGLYRLEVQLQSASDSLRASRAVQVEDGATITVDLTGDLARWTAATQGQLEP